MIYTQRAESPPPPNPYILQTRRTFHIRQADGTWVFTSGSARRGVSVVEVVKFSLSALGDPGAKRQGERQRAETFPVDKLFAGVSLYRE